MPETPENIRIPLPKEGLVPDKETAIKIAEVVLFRLYGEKAIIDQRPYRVKEEDFVWWISGSMKKDTFGAIFTIAVSRQTGAILHLALN
jgi:NTF2 fold immunity protein